MFDFLKTLILQNQGIHFIYLGLASICILVTYLLSRRSQQQTHRQIREISELLGSNTSSVINGLREIQTKSEQLNRLRLALIDSYRTVEHLNQMHQQSLRSSVEEHKEFTSVFAHEIRTPLNGLLGLLKQARDQDIERNVPALVRIEDSANKLNKIIQSTLDYQLLKQGLSTSRTEQFLLADLKNSLTEALAPAQKRRIIITFTEHSPIKLEADIVRITKILNHLIDNALKFSPVEKKVIVDMHYQVKSGRTYLQLSVLDRGIGISQFDRESIFLPFYQVGRGLRRKFEGTGMGLTATKRLVESLEGQITVDSMMNISTRFDVSIPIKTAQPKADKKEANVSDPPAKEQFGRRVLLVEDNELNIDVAKNFLKGNFGCTVTSVQTGEAAIELFEKNEHFDVVLMDINLGEGIDGLQTTSLLKTRWPDTCPPVFALTASTLSIESTVARSVGLEDVLNKPLEEENFVLAWQKYQRSEKVKASF